MTEEPTLVLKGKITYCPISHSIFYTNDECFSIVLPYEQRVILAKDVAFIRIEHPYHYKYEAEYLFLLPDGYLLLTNSKCVIGIEDEV